MDTEDVEHIARKFWNSGRVMLAGIFILGLVVGGFVTNKYIDPYLNGAQNADRNSLLAQNQGLDARSDQLYRCLAANNIDPNSCQSGQVQPPAPPKVYSVIREFKSALPFSGTRFVDGYVAYVYSCPACPEGALCSPCMPDNIIVSDVNKPIGTYSPEGETELAIFTKESGRFAIGEKYRFEVRVAQGNETELVAYSRP